MTQFLVKQLEVWIHLWYNHIKKKPFCSFYLKSQIHLYGQKDIITKSEIKLQGSQFSTLSLK